MTPSASTSTLPLTGRVIIVTGGGAGLGRAICQAIAEAGATVVVAAPGANGAETAALLSDAGHHAIWLKTDVTSAADVRATITETVERLGAVHGVVHNATSRLSSQAMPLPDLSLDDWDDHVAVSLNGARHLAHASFPHLASTAGRFVVMTSAAGMEGSTALPAYGAVKGAIRGFTKSLALEWGPAGIAVNCIAPLAMTTAMERAYESNPNLEAGLRRSIPLGRVGDAYADVAPTAVFLLSDAAGYISGQTLVVDGGRFTTL